MNPLIHRLLNTDLISYEVFGFWRSLGHRLTRLVPYIIRNWWTNHVRTIYAPQHSSLRAAIPKTWCDLDGCIESFLFACVIDFVEKEKGLEDWEGPHQEGHRKEQAPMLREVYDWAKTGRFDAEKTMYAARPMRKGVFDFDCDYSEYNRLSTDAETKTDRYVQWIVRWRGFMWT